MKSENENSHYVVLRIKSFLYRCNCSAILFLLIIVMTGSMMKDMVNAKDKTGEKEIGNKYTHLTISNNISDIVNHPALQGFAELLLPWNDNSGYYSIRLINIGSLMPYHGNVNPGVVLDSVNYMIDEVKKGRTIFYNFYSEQQKQQDPGKRNTGLFFYRGKPDAPFAIICPGGGFSYVGSLHEGFPLALELSKHGFNAFVIRYRIGSEEKSTEDLAAAIIYIFRNADKLGVVLKNYSLWGSSAGARMVGNIALNGVAGYSESNIPRPSTAVIAYTGQSSYSEDFPPSFIIVSENDSITNSSIVDKRVEDLKNSGVIVEYHRYKKAGHGFGLGIGTDAEGWINTAISFWERYMPD